LLGETINAVGVGGIAITIGGVTWLTMHKKNREPHENRGFGSNARGIGFGILAALCQGIGLVLAKKGMTVSDGIFELTPVHATWMRMVAGTITVFSFTLLSGRLAVVSRPVFRNQGNGLKFMVMGTLFGPVFGVSLSLLTITYLTVPVAQTIFALVPVFVLPGAYLYYRERITRKSVVGAFIAIAGVVILIWRRELTVALQNVLNN
jgi:drug/metabolite transporter (DMT)-like permease